MFTKKKAGKSQPYTAPRSHLMSKKGKGTSFPLLETTRPYINLFLDHTQPDIPMDPVKSLIGPDGQGQCPIFRPLSHPRLSSLLPRCDQKTSSFKYLPAPQNPTVCGHHY